MSESRLLRERRIGDPYRDRRSGDDRREVYDLEFFDKGGMERRSGVEIRQKQGRRVQCVNVSEWSCICPPRKSTRKIKANRP
jgi:hypothetical protein